MSVRVLRLQWSLWVVQQKPPFSSTFHTFFYHNIEMNVEYNTVWRHLKVHQPFHAPARQSRTRGLRGKAACFVFFQEHTCVWNSRGADYDAWMFKEFLWTFGHFFFQGFCVECPLKHFPVVVWAFQNSLHCPLWWTVIHQTHKQTRTSP